MTDFILFECEDCSFIRHCRHAFGRFWTDKSRNGRGCRHPFRVWSDEWSAIVNAGKPDSVQNQPAKAEQMQMEF